MALVLSVRRGDDLYVGDDHLLVVAVRKNDRVMDVRVERTGKTLEVTDEQSVEILPDVFLSAGQPNAPGFGRLMITAPREITILRGSVKRGEHRGGEAELIEDRREKRFWQ